MRKTVIAVTAVAIALAVVVGGAVAADFGASIYAEYRLSTSVRKAASLGSDPFVAILGFPFIPQAMRDHYDELEIKANAVDHAMVGKATLEAIVFDPEYYVAFEFSKTKPYLLEHAEAVTAECGVTIDKRPIPVYGIVLNTRLDFT